MKTVWCIILILCVWSLGSKVASQTWRHFNPPPPSIVGP